MSEAEYQDWFDSDGRLVREARMRQRVFEGERASRDGLSKVNFGDDGIIWGKETLESTLNYLWFGLVEEYLPTIYGVL